MKTDKSWLLATLGSFIATVLGIVLTFGVSKVVEIKNSRELQKQCVYNAITDINNVITFLKKDSSYCAAWYPMLPDYVEQYAKNEKVPFDTAASYFLYSYNSPTVLLNTLNRYNPVGQNTIESIAPTNAFDMQLHRYISLAYQDEAEARKIEDEFYKFYNRLIDLKVKITYSTKTYESKEIAELYLGDETVQQFAYFLRYVCEKDTFNYYIKLLQGHQKRILKYSGLTEDDYQKFREQVDHKQNKTAELKISIFCDHIETIAQQEGISFAQAATLVREIGYTGVDAWIGTSDEKMKTLDSLGFKHASAIASIYFTDGEKGEECSACLDWMKAHRFDRVLVVPGFLSSPEDLPVVAERLSRFAGKAADEGIWIMAEDYDNENSPCYNIARLNQLFEASDKLGHVLDSGNYLFAGEDCLKAIKLFRDRIGHVHLKDRCSVDDMTCPPVGTGCIPIRKIVKRLMDSGYDGWLTVEQFGSKSMLPDARTSFNNVKAAVEAARQSD